MGKSYVESSLKRFLKRKVKVTLGMVVAFLITGSVGFAENIVANKGTYDEKAEFIRGEGAQGFNLYGSGVAHNFSDISEWYFNKGASFEVNTDSKKGSNGGITVASIKASFIIGENEKLSVKQNGPQVGIQVTGTSSNYGVFEIKGNNSILEVNAVDRAISVSNNVYPETNSDSAKLIITGMKEVKLTGAKGMEIAEGTVKMENIGSLNIISDYNKDVFQSETNETISLRDGSKVNLQADSIRIENKNTTPIWDRGESHAISVDDTSSFTLTGNRIDIISKIADGLKINPYVNDINKAVVNLNAGEDGIINIKSGKYGIETFHQADVDIKAGIFSITGSSTQEAAIGILSNHDSTVDIIANTVIIESGNQGIQAWGEGKGNGGGTVNINAEQSQITGKNLGLYAVGEGKISFTNEKGTNIISGNITADKKGKISFANINGTNTISGNITASTTDSEVIIKGKGNQIFSADSNKVQEIDAFYDGIVDIDLREQGFLKGKVNDYRVGYGVGTSGTIKLNLDNGRWESQGKGSVTEVNLTNGGTIKFADKASSIDIQNLKGNGNGTFEMTVNSENKSDGNMIYVQNSEGGKYQISLQDCDLSKIKVGDKIRFATIGQGAKNYSLTFTVLDVKEKGIKNVTFTVGNEKFEKGDTENKTYNKGTDKSGNKYVEDNYENGENWYLTRDEYKEPENPDKPDPDKNINDIGKTIIEMARANYASAVYMDNLNKRLGDMSFVEGNSGLWVRMRNDRVGEDKEYRLHNYMTQIGYDKTYTLDEGKEYRGAALEYTKGDMKYKNLNGKTEMDRYMFTVYDTRVYNNGLYADYTGRAGYMSSDFEVTGRETGAKAEGDYHNLILGAGAEFGKRYDFGETSYFEPQVQLQYTYIDDADYTTSQDTKVKYEEIHSLIGRAGVRLGHDFYKENSKDNTIYLKADINHEFLGEQDIKAQDVTGTINKTYENDNTWYDVGIGGAKNLTENLYVYADIERQFGEERDNSWQFNLGFRYKFGSFKDFTFNAANLFDFDKSEVKAEGKEMIKNASEIMNAKKLKGTLSIEGHTDWTGDEEYNQILSEKRAKAVEEVFKENVTNENINYETKGYGETRPVADNKTKEGRAKNRRVEMKFNKN